MSVAERVPPTGVESLSWVEICEQHPGEWVCMLDVDSAPDGSIQAGRVIGHDRSMRQLLMQIGALDPEAVVVHTSGRPSRTPRIEITDEGRDIVRPRR